jgi:hypothetical protein
VSARPHRFVSGPSDGPPPLESDSSDSSGSDEETGVTASHQVPRTPLSPLQGRVPPEVALVLGMHIRSEPIPADVGVSTEH